MKARLSRAGRLKGMWICGVASFAALALTIAPAGAQAASPILEFVPSGAAFPIPFEAQGTQEVSARLNDFDPILHCTGSEGEGEILGPRAAVGDYFFTGCTAKEGMEPSVKCKSAGAEEEEIVAEDVDAELVYVDQANHEVAMLLEPAGGIYMKFSCGGEPVEARGPFLSPVSELNRVDTSFSAILKRNGTQQFPHEYENSLGQKVLAVPTGKRESSVNWEASAVELAFAIHTASPLEIKAINSAEIETKQRADEEAAAKKKQEEDAAKAAEAKKRQEEADAKAAAERKLQEEAKKHEEELRQKAQAKKRAQQRTKALKQCRQLKTPQKQTRCKTRVKKKFSAPKAHTMRVSRF